MTSLVRRFAALGLTLVPACCSVGAPLAPPVAAAQPPRTLATRITALGSSFAGSYAGPLDLTASSSWGSYDLGACDAVVDIAPDGSLSGTAPCTSMGGGWGGGGSLTLDISGTVGLYGSVTGTVSADLGYDIVSLDMTGNVDSYALNLECTGSLSTWGTTSDIVGTGVLAHL